MRTRGAAWREAAAATVAAALLVVAPTDASFPGRDGKILITGSYGYLNLLSGDGKRINRLLDPHGRAVIWSAGIGFFADWRLAGTFSFAPGGQTIAYSCFPKFRSQATAICVVNIDGTHRRVITHPSASRAAAGGPGDGYPVWSPDGRRIAFQRREDNNYIYVVNADGTGLTRVETGPACTLAGHAQYGTSAPDWSPAGPIAFFCGTNYPVSLGLFITDDSRQPARRIDCADAALGTPGGYSAPPVFSPDGSRIAFGPNPYTDPQDLLVSIRADAATTGVCDQQPLLSKSASQSLFGVAWAPDGQKIAFVGSQSRTLYVADVGQPDSARPIYRTFLPLRGPAWQCLGSCRLH